MSIGNAKFIKAVIMVDEIIIISLHHDSRVT